MLSKRTVFSVLGLAALVAAGTRLASPQAAPPVDPVTSEIQIVGGYSVGNLHLFGFSDNRHILPLGAEYDHRLRDGVIGSRLDYVAEFLPVVLLNEPAKYALNGKALTTERRQQYGAGASPAGLRLMWRKPGQYQPYLIAKGGVLYFKDRVLSTEGTHLQWSAEFSAGLEKAISRRFGYRIAYNDFHFSNGDIGRHNPGIDLMEISAGLTVRLH